MKKSIVYLWIITFSIICANELSAQTITSDVLKLTLNEKSGIVELSSTDGNKPLFQNLEIGSVLLPGKEAAQQFSSTNFKGMEVKPIGTDRLDITLPYGEKNFYLSLKLTGSMLTVVFDSNPVQELWGQRKPSARKRRNSGLIESTSTLSGSETVSRINFIAKGTKRTSGTPLSGRHTHRFFQPDETNPRFSTI